MNMITNVKKNNHRVLTRREQDYSAALNYLKNLLSHNTYAGVDPLVMMASFNFGNRQLNALVDMRLLTRLEITKGRYAYRKEDGFDAISGPDLALYCPDVDREAERRATRKWEKQNEDDFDY